MYLTNCKYWSCWNITDHNSLTLLAFFKSEISRMSLATCSLFRQSRPHRLNKKGRHMSKLKRHGQSPAGNWTRIFLSTGCLRLNRAERSLIVQITISSVRGFIFIHDNLQQESKVGGRTFWPTLVIDACDVEVGNYVIFIGPAHSIKWQISSLHFEFIQRKIIIQYRRNQQYYQT